MSPAYSGPWFVTAASQWPRRWVHLIGLASRPQTARRTRRVISGCRCYTAVGVLADG
jgi:hypothetical protein